MDPPAFSADDLAQLLQRLGLEGRVGVLAADFDVARFNAQIRAQPPPPAVLGPTVIDTKTLHCVVDRVHGFAHLRAADGVDAVHISHRQVSEGEGRVSDWPADSFAHYGAGLAAVAAVIGRVIDSIVADDGWRKFGVGITVISAGKTRDALVARLNLGSKDGKSSYYKRGYRTMIGVYIATDNDFAHELEKLLQARYDGSSGSAVHPKWDTDFSSERGRTPKDLKRPTIVYVVLQ